MKRFVLFFLAMSCFGQATFSVRFTALDPSDVFKVGKFGFGAVETCNLTPGELRLRREEILALIPLDSIPNRIARVGFDRAARLSRWAVVGRIFGQVGNDTMRLGGPAGVALGVQLSNPYAAAAGSFLMFVYPLLSRGAEVRNTHPEDFYDDMLPDLVLLDAAVARCATHFVATAIQHPPGLVVGPMHKWPSVQPSPPAAGLPPYPVGEAVQQARMDQLLDALNTRSR